MPSFNCARNASVFPLSSSSLNALVFSSNAFIFATTLTLAFTKRSLRLPKIFFNIPFLEKFLIYANLKIIIEINTAVSQYVYIYWYNTIKRPTAIAGILKKSSPLKNITQQLQHLEQLEFTIKALLPTEFTAHIHVSNISDSGRLTITCNSSAWATQLRYQLPTLLHNLHTDNIAIKDINLRVSPAWTKPQ